MTGEGRGGGTPAEGTGRLLGSRPSPPPRPWSALLRWAAHRLEAPEIAVDAAEIFHARVLEVGGADAHRWYRRQALIAVGQALRPQTRAFSVGKTRPRARLWDSLTREVLLGGRKIRRGPSAAASFAAVVGIGISAVAFIAQVRTSMLSPDGGVAREATTVVWVDDKEVGTPFIDLTGREAWLNDSPGPIAALTAIWSVRATFATPTGLIRSAGERVLPRHLGKLGVTPVRGRDLEQAGEIVLATTFWTDRWESSPDAVGSTIIVDGEVWTIVGVAPPGFSGPLCCTRPDYWLVDEPLVDPASARLVALDVSDRRGGESWLTRVTEGQSTDRRADLDHPRGRPFGGEAGFVAQVLRILFGLAVAVWAMTLLSGANLILGDTFDRRQELRLRSAIGASAGHTLARTLIETGWLAALAAVFGLLASGLMVWIAPWLLPILGPDSTVSVHVGPATLVASTLGAGLSALVCACPSVIVAIRLSRSADVDRGPERRKLAGVGLATQVALASGMLLITGLLLDSVRLLDGDFVGFRNGGTAVHFLSANPPVAPGAILDAVPGARLAVTARLPVYGQLFDSVAIADGSRYRVASETVTPGFFDVVGSRLLAGGPATADGEVVVSSDLALHMGGPQRSLGASLVLSDSVELRVTGVVESATWGSGELRPTIFRAWGSRTATNAVLLVDDVNATREGFGSLLTAFGPLGIALEPFETLDGLLIRSRVIEVFLSRLATGFAVLAQLVAIGAIHAHFTRWVRTRERHLAIRVALGARFPAIGRQVLGTALLGVIPGMICGAGLGWVTSRLLERVLGPLPPITAPIAFALTGAVLSVTMLALSGPLLRARRIDPLTLIRSN